MATFPTPAKMAHKVNPGYKTRFYFASLTKDAALPLSAANMDAYEVPLSTEVTYSPAGNVTTVAINNLDGSSIATRLGQSDTFQFTTHAGSGNAVVRDLVEVANGKDAGKGLFVFLNPDGLYISGECVIQQAVPQSATGGIAGYQVSGTVNGRAALAFPDPDTAPAPAV